MLPDSSILILSWNVIAKIQMARIDCHENGDKCQNVITTEVSWKLEEQQTKK